MRFTRRSMYSAVFAVAVFFISMFAPIVPCQTAPLVPNPTYQWQLCTLNPDSINTIGQSRVYLGMTIRLIEAYFYLIIISFVLAMVVLHFVARDKRK